MAAAAMLKIRKIAISPQRFDGLYLPGGASAQPHVIRLHDSLDSYKILYAAAKWVS